MTGLEQLAAAIRIAGCVMVLGGSLCIGWKLAAQAEDHVCMAGEWRQALLYLSSEIRYMRSPLPQILLAAEGRTSRRVWMTLRRIGEALTNGQGQALDRVWEKTLEQDWKGSLAPRVYEVLSGLGGRLGQIDTQAQCGAIALADERLKQWEAQQQEELGRKVKLYRALSLLAGSGGVLLML